VYIRVIRGKNKEPTAVRIPTTTTRIPTTCAAAHNSQLATHYWRAQLAPRPPFLCGDWFRSGTTAQI